MNKNKLVKISVVDLYNDVMQTVGSANAETIIKIVTLSKQNNLPCLSFLSLEFDTYYNEPQMEQIKKEIKILKNEISSHEDKLFLEKVYDAIPVALEEGYLKFEPQ